MGKFQPELANQKLEDEMERHDLPESDRDELRCFSQFLDKSAVPVGLKPWVYGEDVPPNPPAGER